MKIVSYFIEALITALILPAVLLWLIWYILKGVLILLAMVYFAFAEGLQELFKRTRQC